MTTKTEINLQQLQARVEDNLQTILQPSDREPVKLHSAMRYATLNGGKRLRPLLVYASGFACGADIEQLDYPATAVELIHCYSLVHDDLPSMDDDDLRRGKPSCHIAFDTATAILTGDALQSLAFETLSKTLCEPTQLIHMLQTLPVASGSLGMAGGQALDLAGEGKNLSLDEIETIHRLKSGALIKASILLGALTRFAPDAKEIQHLTKFADHIGLAFQIQDDILDIEGSTEQLGKMTGSDLSLEKSTYPSLLGIQQAKDKVKKHYQLAIQSLQQLPFNIEILKTLSHMLTQRES